jgi:hypothetical protein
MDREEARKTMRAALQVLTLPFHERKLDDEHARILGEAAGVEPGKSVNKEQAIEVFLDVVFGTAEDDDDPNTWSNDTDEDEPGKLGQSASGGEENQGGHRRRNKKKTQADLMPPHGPTPGPGTTPETGNIVPEGGSEAPPTPTTVNNDVAATDAAENDTGEDLPPLPSLDA